jgi:cytoskeletal protein RodZ
MRVAAESGVDASTRLRTAREEAGLSVEEIASRTKIKVGQLHALEGGHYEQLPGPFFTRAFIATYARELHLPPGELLAEFDAQQQPQVDVATPGEVAQPRPPPVAGLAGRATLASHADGRSRWLRPAAIVGVSILALSLGVFYARGLRETAPPEPGAVGTLGTPNPSPSAPAAAPSGEPQRLVMELRPSRTTWITGTADGRRVLYRLVNAGERITLGADRELAFRVGDAGAFVYSLNGREGVPVGDAGAVRSFVITRGTASSFVR